jgi:transposase
MQVTAIGRDIAKTAKTVLQMHGTERDGNAVLRKRLARAQVLRFFANLPPCLIGMEACAGAHCCARELTGLGHQVRLTAPQYVKAYVKTNQHDAAGAEGCGEAVPRPLRRER